MRVRMLRRHEKRANMAVAWAEGLTRSREEKRRDRNKPAQLPVYMHPDLAAPSLVGTALGSNLAASAGRQARNRMHQEPDLGFESRIEEARKKWPGVRIEREGIPDEDILKALPRPLRETQLGKQIAKSFPQRGPAYLPATKTVYMNNVRARSVLDHELGHATGFKVLQHPAIRVGAPLLGGIPATFMASRKLRRAYKESNPEEQEKLLRSGRNYAAVAGALTAGPTLVEEARATAKALMRAPREMRGEYLKTLAPAYGTYAGLLGVPAVAAPLAIEYFRRRAARDALERRGRRIKKD